MFYFRILNLPVTLSTLTSTIFPFAVVKSSDLAKNSFDFVHWPLIQEIKMLETEGMSLDIPDYPNFKLYGTLSSNCGDTKGAHQQGGFMSPSADKLCRFCLISRKDIINLKTLDNLTMRNKVNYDEAVIKSSGIDGFSRRKESAVEKGCILNELKYFPTESRMDIHFIVDASSPILGPSDWSVNMTSKLLIGWFMPIS